MRKRGEWGGYVETVVPAVAVGAGVQAAEDRVPSTATNKAQLVNQRAAIGAGVGGLLGIGGLALGLLGGKTWAEKLGIGFLTGASVIGSQLGMAYVDSKMGIADPGPTPSGFEPVDLGPAAPTNAGAIPLPASGTSTSDAFNTLAPGYVF